jgi:uncharacterized protein (DUF488 family)
MRIWTVGHSTHSVAELAAIVKAHGVEQIVDIRTIRRSRANPQFNEAVIGKALARRDVGYRIDEALGGRRGKAKVPPKLANDAWENASFKNYADYALTAEFRAGLTELMQLAKQTPTAIMCAEAVWWRCHRRIVADWLIARKVEVLHIMSATSAPEATLTPFAKIVRGRVHYPK